MGMKPLAEEAPLSIRNTVTNHNKRDPHSPIKNMSVPPSGSVMPKEQPIKNSVQHKHGK